MIGILVLAWWAFSPAGTLSGSVQPRQDYSPAAEVTTGSTEPDIVTGTAANPEKPATVAPAGWVTAFGDSVMLGAVDALLQEMPNLSLIDTQGSRQPPDAIDVLQRRGAAGQFGDSVIVHIGNNGPFTAEQFDEMMQALAGARQVLVVNLTVPPGVEDPIAAPNNAVLADGVRRYPNSVLVDWHAASANHPEFSSEDRIHLTLQGAQAYADLITSYLGSPEEGLVMPPGPQERTSRGKKGSFGVCVGPSSWCSAIATP